MRSDPRGPELVRDSMGIALRARPGVQCEQCLADEARRADAGESHGETDKSAGSVCKHREKEARPSTPDGFYKLTFDETQTLPPSGEELAEGSSQAV